MSDATRTHPGRIPLIAWEDARPANFYLANPLLGRVLERMRPGSSQDARLAHFGAEAAGPIDAAARENDFRLNHPRLERFDAIGRRTEGIVFHPTYHEAGRPTYESGILSCMAETGNVWLQSALFYLLGHNGEMGHLCPATCTAGMIRAIQQKGSDELKARWLPGLLSDDYDRKLHGSQFLTEVHSGSDVGGNVVEARPDPDEPGVYRLWGEKWFCSVADAPLYLIVARPTGAEPGTAGLGCFLMPREIDGIPNDFSLRRLKEKIGTRTMASGEIDLEGARAWPIGAVDEGFKIAVGIVLNTSRFMNALGSAAAMQRAWYEAAGFAAHREAFGGSIGRYPLVRETLARIRTEAGAALVSTMYLAELIEAMDEGRASDEDIRVHRLLVNANKYWTSIVGTDVIRDAIEILGGNGAIETFSVLPRLWRDSIVLESWEGAHNVLCLQVLRDAAKLDLIAVAGRRLAAILDESGHVDPALADELRGAWGEVEQAFAACLADPAGHGQQHIRRAVTRLMQVFQAALLLRQAAWEAGRDDDTTTLVMARHLTRTRVRRNYAPETDPDWQTGIEAVLADTRLAGARQ